MKKTALLMIAFASMPLIGTSTTLNFKVLDPDRTSPAYGYCSSSRPLRCATFKEIIPWIGFTGRPKPQQWDSGTVLFAINREPIQILAALSAAQSAWEGHWLFPRMHDLKFFDSRLREQCHCSAWVNEDHTVYLSNSAIDNYTADELRLLFVHELGHLLGIVHSVDEKDVMHNPFGTTITDVDIAIAMGGGYPDELWTPETKIAIKRWLATSNQPPTYFVTASGSWRTN